jgi:hypothetical protein
MARNMIFRRHLNSIHTHFLHSFTLFFFVNVHTVCLMSSFLIIFNHTYAHTIHVLFVFLFRPVTNKCHCQLKKKNVLTTRFRGEIVLIKWQE